jgi:cystathionine beta-lyase family protein involved in aluminum resistance
LNRSCGYQWRPSIPVQEIGRLCSFIEKTFKSKGREIIIFTDNCYGELVEEEEPLHVGADLIAGSLIKNLGGTLAPCGGYVAGKAHLVNGARVRLSAPGVDGGATLQQYRTLFQVSRFPLYTISSQVSSLQGLFMAPSVIGESLKGAALLANVMGKQLGYPCNPPVDGHHRTDIVQAVQLNDRKKVIVSFAVLIE